MSQTIPRHSSADSSNRFHCRQRTGDRRRACRRAGPLSGLEPWRVGDMFYIRIGDRSNVQDNCVLHTRTGEKPTILEE